MERVPVCVAYDVEGVHGWAPDNAVPGVEDWGSAASVDVDWEVRVR
jgi:hypothetical protein